MREMEWIFCEPLENTELIEEFEKTSNFTFPETYKECVKKYACGRPKGMVFKTKKYGDVNFRLYTFAKETSFYDIWEINNDFSEFILRLETAQKQCGLNSDEELRLKKYKYIVQNYVLFAAGNLENDLAFDKTNGAVVFIDDITTNKTLITETIADSFDEFIEELYNRERTGVYDDIEWDCFKPLKSESIIEEYEKAINYTFPESFKECVKKYNGADSGKYVFECTVNYDYCDDDETSFYFCSFNKEDSRSIWDLSPMYEVLEEVKIFKNNYVIFGKNFFGDFLTFKRSNGSVVFWEYGTMYHKTVGKSFDDFLSNVYLREEPIYVTY